MALLTMRKGPHNSEGGNLIEPANQIIGCRDSVTLPGLFCERINRTPEGLAYREYDAMARSWRDHTWGSIGERAARFREALSQEQLAPGDRVAVLLPNGVDWVCFDMSALSLGLIVVPLYVHDGLANISYILNHAEIRLLFLDTADRWQALSRYSSESLSLDRIWVQAGQEASSSNGKHPSVSFLGDILPTRSGAFSTDVSEAKAPATLIYTSGTTGRPKGVLLSHFALLWNAESCSKFIPPRQNDVFLSFLPLAHAFERTVGYYLAMMGGSCVAYARSIEALRDDLLAIRPTVLVSVPRVYERIYAGIHSQVERKILKRFLLRLTASLGWRRFEAERGRGPGLGLTARLMWPILDRFVAKPILRAFGGRLRVTVSGGAPLAENVARFLIGIGLPLVEGYGLTETAPVVTATALDDIYPGSVGQPLKGLELRLSEEGELLVRSPAAMMRYWKDDDQTAATIDNEGWLKTGDLAEIRDGRVFIQGRLKELLVLATGEKVHPSLVESEITKDELFDQAIVVGEGMPYLAAILVLNKKEWRSVTDTHRIAATDLSAAVARGFALTRVQNCLKSQPRSAQVYAIHLILEPWTIEAGLITPTLKIKRQEIERIYQKEIAELYTGHPVFT